MSSLDQFGDSILLLILQHLSVADLLATVPRVSHRWHTVINDHLSELCHAANPLPLHTSGALVWLQQRPHISAVLLSSQTASLLPPTATLQDLILHLPFIRSLTISHHLLYALRSKGERSDEDRGPARFFLPQLHSLHITQFGDHFDLNCLLFNVHGLPVPLLESSPHSRIEHFTDDRTLYGGALLGLFFGLMPELQRWIELLRPPDSSLGDCPEYYSLPLQYPSLHQLVIDCDVDRYSTLPWHWDIGTSRVIPTFGLVRHLTNGHPSQKIHYDTLRQLIASMTALCNSEICQPLPVTYSLPGHDSLQLDWSTVHGTHYASAMELTNAPDDCWGEQHRFTLATADKCFQLNVRAEDEPSAAD